MKFASLWGMVLKKLIIYVLVHIYVHCTRILEPNFSGKQDVKAVQNDLSGFRIGLGLH